MIIVLFWLSILLCVAAGTALVVQGVLSIKTSISWKNRPKVAEENKVVFGKLMGTARIIGGIGVLLFGVLSVIAKLTTKKVLMTIGMYLAIATLAVAMCIYIYTMTKYNK